MYIFALSSGYTRQTWKAHSRALDQAHEFVGRPTHVLFKGTYRFREETDATEQGQRIKLFALT